MLSAQRASAAADEIELIDIGGGIGVNGEIIAQASGEHNHYQRSQEDEAEAAAAAKKAQKKLEEKKAALAPVWAQRPFSRPVSAIAFTHDGEYAAACCAAEGKVGTSLECLCPPILAFMTIIQTSSKTHTRTYFDFYF